MRITYKAVTALIVWGLMLASGAQAQSYGTTYTNASSTLVTKSGELLAFSCAGGGPCSTTATVTVAAGYSIQQVWLTGYRAWFSQSGQVLPVRRIKIAMKIDSYNSVTGAVTWKLETEVRSSAAANTPYKIDAFFQIALAQTSEVSLTSVTQSCSSTSGGTCTNNTTHTGVAPTGYTFAGFAFSAFDLQITEAGGAGISMWEMGADASSWTQSSSNITLTLAGVLRDTSTTEDMQLDATLVAIAAKSVAAQFVARADDSTNTATAFSTNVTTGAGASRNGAAAGLDKWNNIFTSGNARNIWRWDAGYNAVGMTGGNTWSANKIGFLGDTWNNTTSSGNFTTTTDSLVIFLM